MNLSAPRDWIRMRDLLPGGSLLRRADMSELAVRPLGTQGVMGEHTEHPNWLPTRPHRAKLRRRCRHRASEHSPRIVPFEVQGSTSVLLHVLGRR